MNTGLNIKLKRIEKGYLEKDFSQIVNITPQYLRLIEKGIAKNPSKNLMSKIAKALDSSVQELFFDKIK